MKNRQRRSICWFLLAALAITFISVSRPAVAEVKVSIVPFSAGFAAVAFSGALLNFNGTLYGTTTSGGTDPGTEFGTIFVAGPNGLANVYEFSGGMDGSGPNSIVAFGNMIYGTTLYGGGVSDTTPTSGSGTVFSFTSSGQKTLLYALERFKGRQPVGLTPVGGSLYLTAASGGRTKHGSVLKVRLSGGARSIYEFQGGSNDGEKPGSPLLNYAGTLYGTTFGGGANGAGTVYKITPAGVEAVLHSFDESTEGCCSPGGLLRVGMSLYGVTIGEFPSLYDITPGGQFSVLEKLPVPFGVSLDPNGPLVRVGNKFYGTTAFGGKDLDGSIYQVTLMGRYREIYHFPSNGTRGIHPNSGLVNVNGTLYGTTPTTVFYFTPNPADDAE